MRLKKQKRQRRAVRFYTTCFGFREPFKVLCDGTFVHHLIANSITPADTAISKILGGTVKIFTSSCVLAELKSLGKDYSESLTAARKLMIARCDHEKRKSAVACIRELIGETNPDHFFVATQDATDLRKKLQEVPGVPVIFGLRKALHLEPPSAFQRQFTKSTEVERSQMSELEYKMLRLKKKRSSDAEKDTEFSDVNEIERDQILGTQSGTKTSSGRKRLEMKEKAQFKRKKAKGPNPKSCLKKKKKKNCEQPNLVSPRTPTENNDGGETSLRCRQRKKRKRSRKGKKLEETSG